MRTEASGSAAGAVFRVYRLRKAGGVDKEEEIVRLESSRLDIGARSPATLILDDPVAAELHCSIEYDGERFELIDGENASGTYRNGIRVLSATPLQAGDVLVVGVASLTVGIDVDGARPRLSLELKENSFFFKQKDRKEFRSDPDQWVVSEWTFGRFRALAAANWLVALPLVVILPIVLFASFVRQPLFDPGPLAAGHADLFDASIPRSGALAQMAERARQEGCASCHDAFGGTPMSKCAECHRDVMEGRHPFHAEPFDAALSEGKVDRDYAAHDCNLCHTDHRGRDPEEGAFVPTRAMAGETCTHCHSSEQLRAPRTRPLAAVETNRSVDVPYTAFPHAAHLAKKIDCATCHGAPRATGGSASVGLAADADSRARRDFEPVAFETCRACHDKTALNHEWKDLWPAEAKRYDLAWHGAEADGGKSCLACHDRLFEAPLRATGGTSPKSESHPQLEYTLERYDHKGEFASHAGRAAGEDCASCHVHGAPKVPVAAKGVFWHALHLKSAVPSSPEARRETSAACAACHDEQAASDHLTNGTFLKSADSKNCAECHRSGGSLALVPTPAAANTGAERRRADFPHGVHLRAMGEGGTPHSDLASGCYSCHSLESLPDAPAESRAFQLFPRTDPEASKCLPCHRDHGAIAGGGCLDCHPTLDGQADAVYSGKPRTRTNWPALNDFDHSSVGHRDSACVDCHGGDRSLENAKSVLDVPVPIESDAACQECHQKTRFHWR